MGNFTGIRIHNWHSGACIIHKEFFTGSVMLSHGTFLAASPLVVAMAVLGVAVGIQREGLTVLFPERVFGDTFAFEFLVKLSPVRVNQPFSVG